MWLPICLFRDWKRDPHVPSYSPDEAHPWIRSVIWTSLNDPFRATSEHDAGTCFLHLFRLQDDVLGDTHTLVSSADSLCFPSTPLPERAFSHPRLCYLLTCSPQFFCEIRFRLLLDKNSHGDCHALTNMPSDTPASKISVMHPKGD